jgi:hypothetical protein
MEYKISETSFQSTVIDLAHTLGWYVAHFRVAQTKHGWRTPVAADGEGWPDLVLVHEDKRRTIYAELKSEVGQPSPEQYFWLLRLTRCQREVYLWRPSDSEPNGGIIAKILQGGT